MLKSCGILTYKEQDTFDGMLNSISDVFHIIWWLEYTVIVQAFSIRLRTVREL